MRKKLGLLLTVGLVGLVVVATIVLGVIKKDYSPTIQRNYQSVTITNDSGFYHPVGKFKEDFEEDKEFDKLINLYNNSFKQSILASVFSGNSSNKVSVTYSTSSIPQISGYKMEWVLNSEGEKVETTDNLAYEYVVNKLTVGIDNTNGFRSVTIYASIKDAAGGNAHLKITTKANFIALYDYLEELNA